MVLDGQSLPVECIVCRTGELSLSSLLRSEATGDSLAEGGLDSGTSKDARSGETTLEEHFGRRQ